MDFFISDLHLNHNKDFIYKKRGFSTIEEMNKAIIEHWNNIIADYDIIWVLGDCILGDNDSGIQILKQLKGHKHLIFGNHDNASRIQLYKDNNIFESMQYATIIKHGKKSFYLSHYPTLCGNGKFISPYNICGHCHYIDKFADMDKGCYHVECDAHNCTPVSIIQILEDIKEWEKDKEENKNDFN